MATAFDQLSDQQKTQYRERLSRLGCPDHEGSGLRPRSKNGPIHLSSNPRESAVLPHFLQVHDLDELKALAGVPDSLFDSGAVAAADWEPQEEWPAAREVTNFTSIDPKEARRILNAGRAYVLGPSQRFASYKKAFEKLHMPLVVVTFSLQDVTVSPGNPLILSGDHPIVANFGTVTIVDGGQILVQVEATVNMQVLTKVPDSSPS